MTFGMNQGKFNNAENVFVQSANSCYLDMKMHILGWSKQTSEWIV